MYMHTYMYEYMYGVGDNDPLYPRYTDKNILSAHTPLHPNKPRDQPRVPVHLLKYD